MSWFAENKFAAIFGGCIVAGSLGLGYMAFTASEAYNAELEKLRSQKQTLTSLQSSDPFPSPVNLREFEKQNEESAAAIRRLQETLSAAKVELDAAVTPTQFQDRLKAAVERVIKKASEKNDAAKYTGTSLPENFFLGFEYQNQLPDAKAAPRLDQQLKSVEMIVNICLANRVPRIEELTRVKLPEEDPKAEAAPRPSATGTAKKPASEPEKPVISRTPLRLVFTATQPQFRGIVNQIAALKQPLSVIRNIEVQNEKPAVPRPEAPAPAEPAALPADGGNAGADVPSTPVPTPSLSGAPATGTGGGSGSSRIAYFLGEEKLKVTLDVDFVSVEQPAPDKPASARKP